MSKNSKHFNKVSLAVLFFAALIGGISVALVQKSSPERPTLGGEFTLQSADGDVHLSDFRGQSVLIYFGYTHCPDVCPVTLTNIRTALKQLSETEQNKVTTLFISVDPERDSLSHLKNYVRFFGERFVGVTGSKEEIDNVVKQYGAFYRMVETPDSAMGYSVDHSSRVYLLNKDGEVVKFLYHDSSSSEIASAIQQSFQQ